MTSNVNSVLCETNFTTFCIAFYAISQPLKRKKYKNGSAYKFTLEVISWKIKDKNHSCFLLMPGNQCGNKKCKQAHFVLSIIQYITIFVSSFSGPLFLGHAVYLSINWVSGPKSECIGLYRFNCPESYCVDIFKYYQSSCKKQLIQK